MLEKIKNALRIHHTALDNDITTSIHACMLDMRRVGIAASVAVEISEDALIFKAVETYCKWQYDFNGKGEKFEKAYISLRDALSLCEDYNAERVIGDV